jgi:SNF2 family DNA or RNA helicase
MNSKDRQEALRTIAEDDEVKVMLVSMKAGGVGKWTFLPITPRYITHSPPGLNITAANNVIILDPWWNPYVEEQAISRVHRQGQTRDVYVFRIISPNTIEERIKEIQDGKREVVDGYTERCVGVMRRKVSGKVGGG